MLSFREFIPAYNSGAILEDAAWRAYDIQHIAGTRHAKDALKAIGYSDMSFFGFEQAAQDYNIHSVTRARMLLSLWWAWVTICEGRNPRAKLRKGTGNDS